MEADKAEEPAAAAVAVDMELEPAAGARDTPEDGAGEESAAPAIGAHEIGENGVGKRGRGRGEGDDGDEEEEEEGVKRQKVVERSVEEERLESMEEAAAAAGEEGGKGERNGKTEGGPVKIGEEDDEEGVMRQEVERSVDEKRLENVKEEEGVAGEEGEKGKCGGDVGDGETEGGPVKLGEGDEKEEGVQRQKVERSVEVEEEHLETMEQEEEKAAGKEWGRGERDGDGCDGETEGDPVKLGEGDDEKEEEVVKMQKVESSVEERLESIEKEDEGVGEEGEKGEKDGDIGDGETERDPVKLSEGDDEKENEEGLKMQKVERSEKECLESIEKEDEVTGEEGEKGERDGDVSDGETEGDPMKLGEGDDREEEEGLKKQKVERFVEEERLESTEKEEVVAVREREKEETHGDVGDEETKEDFMKLGEGDEEGVKKEKMERSIEECSESMEDEVVVAAEDGEKGKMDENVGDGETEGEPMKLSEGHDNDEEEGVKRQKVGSFLEEECLESIEKGEGEEAAVGEEGEKRKWDGDVGEGETKGDPVKLGVGGDGEEEEAVKRQKVERFVEEDCPESVEKVEAAAGEDGEKGERDGYGKIDRDSMKLGEGDEEGVKRQKVERSMEVEHPESMEEVAMAAREEGEKGKRDEDVGDQETEGDPMKLCQGNADDEEGVKSQKAERSVEEEHLESMEKDGGEEVAGEEGEKRVRDGDIGDGETDGGPVNLSGEGDGGEEGVNRQNVERSVEECLDNMEKEAAAAVGEEGEKGERDGDVGDGETEGGPVKLSEGDEEEVAAEGVKRQKVETSVEERPESIEKEDEDEAVGEDEGKGERDGDIGDGETEGVPVKLGPKSFGSSVEMFDYFFKLLHSWSPNLDINKYENLVLMDLIKKGHPEPDKKIGGGIQAFQVRYHPLWKSRCFFLQRVDGSSDDFSFRKCVDHILALPDDMKVPEGKRSGSNQKGGSHGSGARRGGRGGVLGGRRKRGKFAK